jgi:RNA polymerase sigma factor (sigma-70 family)
MRRALKGKSEWTGVVFKLERNRKPHWQGRVMNPTRNLERPLDALYGVYRDELLRFLTVRIGDADEAQDLLHDLWFRASRSAAAPVANGRAYLYRMAHNLVIDRLRERQRRGRRENLWHEEQTALCDSGSDAGGECADASLSAEEAMIAREEADRLATALQTLPEGAQRVFVLHKLEGLSHADVASRLCISKSGVEKHMAVAMKYLRRAMAD